MLVRTMQSNKDPSIQVNLAHVMIKLVSRASGIELEYALVAEPSCINILVSLLHWPDEEGVIDIVNKATAAIEIIASISPKYRDQVVQTGVMDLLLRSFQQTRGLERSTKDQRSLNWRWHKVVFGLGDTSF